MIGHAMKKLFVLMVGVLYLQTLCAQQQYQLDSVVRNWSHYDMRVDISTQRYDHENRTLISQHEVRGEDPTPDEGSRHYVRYDDRGNEVEYIDSYWNVVKNAWIEREKRTKSYDAQDRMVCYAEYEMRNGTWLGLARVEHSFEDEVYTTTEYQGQGEDWIPVYKNVGLFNDNDQDVLTMNYQWDTVAGDWGYWMKSENTYSQDTLINESARYIWKDGVWTHGEKTEYIYPPDSDKVSDRMIYEGTDDGWKNKYFIQIENYVAARREETFYWSDEEDKWKPESFKETYTDRYGRDTDFVLFLWDEEAVEYKRYSQGMTVYDAQGRMTLVQEVRYDKGVVVEGTQMVRDVDKEGNVEREAYFSLVNKDWVIQSSREFTFNKDILLQDEHGNACVVDQARIGYEQMVKNNHAIDRIRSYRYIDGEKMLQEEERYYYSTMEIGMD